MTEKHDSGDGERYAWECYEERKAQLAQVTAELTQLKKAVAEQLYYDFQAVLTGTPERNAVTRAVAEATRGVAAERDRYRAALVEARKLGAHRVQAGDAYASDVADIVDEALRGGAP